MFPWDKLPNNDMIKEMLSNVSSGQIDKYVQQMVSQMFPKQMEGMINPQEWLKSMPFTGEPRQESSQKLDAAVFETHEHVYMRIPIRDENWLKTMKVYHTSAEAIIENIPEIGDKHTFPFPVSVRKKGTMASHKESVLEIRFIKRSHHQISEVDVNGI